MAGIANKFDRMCREKCVASHMFDHLVPPEDGHKLDPNEELQMTIDPKALQYTEDNVRFVPSDFDSFDPAKAAFLTAARDSKQMCMGTLFSDYSSISYRISWLDFAAVNYERIYNDQFCCQIMEYYPYVRSAMDYTGLSLNLVAHTQYDYSFDPVSISSFDRIRHLGRFFSSPEMAAIFILVPGETSDERLKLFNDNYETILKIRDIEAEVGEFGHYACLEWLGFLKDLPDSIFISENRDAFMEFVEKYAEAAKENHVTANFIGRLKMFSYRDRLFSRRFKKENAKAFLEFATLLLSKVKSNEEFKTVDGYFYDLFSIANNISDFSRFVKLVREFEFVYPWTSFGKREENPNFLRIVTILAGVFASYNNPADRLLEDDYDLFMEFIASIKERVLDIPEYKYSFSNFPFLTESEYWQKISKKDNIQALGFLIKNLPLGILETDRSIIEDALEAPTFGVTADILEAIADIKNLYILKKIMPWFAVFSDYETRKDARSKFVLFDYMAYIGMSEDDIYEFLVSDIREPDAFKPLFTDHRDGTDLLKFNMAKKDVYARLFESLRKGQLSDIETKLAETIDMTSLTEASSGMDLLALYDIAAEIESTISPALARRLFDITNNEISKPCAISDLILGFYDISRKKIDVTQNNIAEINKLLRVLCVLKGNPELAVSGMDAELEAALEEHIPNGNVENTLSWLAEKFDVEEINFSRLKGVDMLAEYITLMAYLEELKNAPATRYLENKIAEMGFETIISGASNETFGKITDIFAIESLRFAINTRNKVLGDQLVDSIGSNYLLSNPPSFENLNKLMEFAKAWELDDNGYDHDVKGLYRQFSRYAFDIIAGFILKVVEKKGGDIDAAKEIFKAHGIELDPILGELAGRGFVLERDGKLKKFVKRLVFNTRYTVRRGMEDGTPLFVDPATIKVTDSAWPAKAGVSVKEIWGKGVELAKLFIFEPEKTGVLVLAERTGIVDTEEEIRRLDNRYVFSAPMTMTTGAHKMTELVFKNGLQISYLWTPEAKDGILIVDKDSHPKIIDKRSIALSEILVPEDINDNAIRRELEKWAMSRGITKSGEELLGERLTPSDVLWDKLLFLRIAALKKFSLLSNILVINGDEAHRISDGNTDRRFFVELNDGSFGVIDSTAIMTTGDLVDIAKAVGIKRAIYMDTGMYDVASYRDGAGKDHIIGHNDTVESTNRVVVYQR